MPGDGATSEDDLFNFDSLKLVDKPDSPMNSRSLSQNLQDCVGYLRSLPLKQPNVNQKIPKTIADMVNILTSPTAASDFVENAAGGASPRDEHREGTPGSMYDYQTSQTMKDQLESSRKRSSHVHAPGVFGHVVLPGCISFYTKDGKTYAVTEGRWWLPSVKASWLSEGRNMALNSDRVSPNSQVLIIRVLKGEVGLVREEGVERLLDVGTHVYNSGTVTLIGKKEYARDDYFQHGRYHYVRVPRGMFAKVWTEVITNGVKSLVPRLLSEGEHFADSPLFKFSGLVPVSDPYIEHGAVHRVSVPKGFVAKVFQDNKPRLLGEGDHIIESTQFEFKGMANVISNECIVHGTITILRVMLGKVALAWRDNEPVFIDEPGLYEFDSPDFCFVEFKNADERLIELGARKIVLVHTGQVGVTYDQGLLKVLSDGRHMINSSTHVFHSFLSTQQRSIRLITLSANEKLSRSTSKSNTVPSPQRKDRQGFPSFADDSDLTICETKDLVKVGLRADVFYSIADPEKCINKIDTDELEDLVRETAVATLTNIVRSTALNEIAQSKQVSAGSTDPSNEDFVPVPMEGNPGPSAPMFFDKAHDEFLSKLHDDFMERYGVDIANIRIESFKIMDVELAEQISKHALTTAQIENEMANLEGKSLISTTEEKTASEIKDIATKADALALKTAADAENQRKIDSAQAEAEALKIAARAKAEAESESILMKAEAQAEAIKMKATAESQRAEMLSKTQLGQQESLLGLYTNMVVGSNKGVEKVIYLDPSVNKDSPFALGSLENLNRDLHSLTQMGIAAGEGTGPSSSSVDQRKGGQ